MSGSPAGVSVEYYSKLERGAIGGVSASVLDAIARALQLDDAERAHLFQAARTGEPILRPLAYHHPGFEDVTDQFLLGEDILAAPVLRQGATTRTVVVPPGDWTAPDGTTIQGPVQRELPVTLESIPWFRRRT